jgi:hypothetical protein
MSKQRLQARRLKNENKKKKEGKKELARLTSTKRKE